MAKRRNLKKEKASRNQSYARQFRKHSYRSSSRNQRFSNNNNANAGQNDTETSNNPDS